MKRTFYFIFLVLLLNTSVFANDFAKVIKVDEFISKESNKLVIYLDKIPEYNVSRGSQNVDVNLNDALVPTNTLQVKSFTLNQVNDNQVLLSFSHQKHKPLNIYVEKNPLRLVVEAKNHFVENTYQLLQKGVEWKNILKSDEGGSLNINHVEIYRSSKFKLKIVSVKNNNTGKMKLSELIKGDNIIAAINGGFFGPNGEAIGYLKINDHSYGFPFRNRAVLGIKDKNCFISRIPFKGKIKIGRKASLNIKGINKKRNTGEIIIYDSSYGKTTNTPTDKPGSDFVVLGNKIIEVYRGNAVIPALGFVISVDGKYGESLAEKVSVKEDKVGLIFDVPPQFKNIDYAVTGGPLLIDNNSIVLNLTAEGFSNAYSNAAPRTALGLAKDKIWLVAVDGRQMRSKGFTLKELAGYLLTLGCYKAMNLDGGGSTTMVIKDRIVNYPSDGAERAINNGIVIIPLKK